MLHAPISETKMDTRQSKPQQARTSERKMYPGMLVATGSYTLIGTDSAMSARSPEVQRHQTLAGLQTMHGNQAVLRMLRGPQRVARMTPLRPSQSIMLQRKCACGGSSETAGECAECKAKRLSLQNAPMSADSNTVPLAANDLLHSPDQLPDTHTLSTVHGEQYHRIDSAKSTIITGDEDTDENIVATIAPRLNRGRFTGNGIPHGTLPATFGSGKFGASFSMNAEVAGNDSQGPALPGTCIGGTCGEYRQFVRGFFKLNGMPLVHRLCSNTLSSTTFHEDCVTQGGTDFKYGYHSIPFPASNFTNPDQATGCTFNGFDFPGFQLAGVSSGDNLEMHLEFQGKVVDACTHDFLFDFASWTVEGNGTAP